jgi:hypothetical protein
VADVRNTVMCLRGWTTPMAVTISAAGASAMEDDVVRSDPRAMRRLEILVGQVVDFARRSDADRLMAGV